MHKIISITAINLQKPNPKCTQAQTWAQRAVTNSPQARAASIKPNHSENTKRPRHPRSLSHTHTHVLYFHTTVRRLKPASLFHEDRYIRKASWGRRNRATLSLSFPFLSIDSEVGIHYISSAVLIFWCLCQSLSVSLSVFKWITVCFEQISIKPLFTDRETIRARAGGDMVCWLNGSVLHFIELKWKENTNAGAEVGGKRKSPSGKYGVLLWLSLINTDFLKSSEVTANRVRLPHMQVQSESSWVACLHNLLPVSINHQSLTGQGAMKGWKREENLTLSKTSMWKKQPLCRVSNTNRKQHANHANNKSHTVRAPHYPL